MSHVGFSNPAFSRCRSHVNPIYETNYRRRFLGGKNPNRLTPREDNTIKGRSSLIKLLKFCPSFNYLSSNYELRISN